MSQQKSAPLLFGLLKSKLLDWQQKNLSPKTQRKVEISTAKKAISISSLSFDTIQRKKQIPLPLATL